MKATLWLGPQDGRELSVSSAVVKSGYHYIFGTNGAVGSYKLRMAQDGLAKLDDKDRLVFEWEGWG